ncbi:20S-pre-rRNA D-site endonuclease nob1, partial [Coemansia thaxteri]
DLLTTTADTAAAEAHQHQHNDRPDVAVGQAVQASEETKSQKKKNKKNRNLLNKNKGKSVVTLVVDTNPFVKGLVLDAIATRFVTVPEVVHELRSRAAKDRYHDLDTRHGIETISPDAESMQAVCNFAKKTGDFASLSVADLKVLALAFMLEKKENGMRWLRTEPVGNNPNISDRKLLACAELAGGDQDDCDGDCQGEQVVEKQDLKDHSSVAEDVPGAELHQRMGAMSLDNNKPVEGVEATNVCQMLDDLMLTDAKTENAPLVLCSVDNDDFDVGSDEDFDEDLGEEEEEGDDDSDVADKNSADDDGWEVAGPKNKRKVQKQDTFFKGDWITPQNVKHNQAISAMGMREAQSVNGPARLTKVACVTSDFAMQNVMLKMGIRLVTPDGVAVNRLSTWVLRCHACFHLTGDMYKQFCPMCGHPTLKRCAVTTGSNGRLQVHLKANYQYNLRGTVYSIPKATGGQHSKRDVITREDDKVYMRAMHYRKTKEAKSNAGLSGANSLFDPDFVPGLFLGGGGSSNNKGYGIATDARGMPMVGRNCKNPNTVRKTGNRKNKRRSD